MRTVIIKLHSIKIHQQIINKIKFVADSLLHIGFSKK